MSKREQCPYIMRSGTETVCLADSTKPVDRNRCTAELKAAVLRAADYLRKEHSRGYTFRTLTEACEREGINLCQVYLYFKSKHEILSTTVGFIPKKREGTDPGEISSAYAVKNDKVKNLSPSRAKKIAEMKEIISMVEEIELLRQSITDREQFVAKRGYKDLLIA